MQTITLNIQGMTCGGCVSSVSNILNKHQGVQQAEVDLASAQAKIAFDPEQTTVESLIEAVEDAGFDAQVA